MSAAVGQVASPYEQRIAELEQQVNALHQQWAAEVASRQSMQEALRDIARLVVEYRKHRRYASTIRNIRSILAHRVADRP